MTMVESLLEQPFTHFAASEVAQVIFLVLASQFLILSVVPCCPLNSLCLIFLHV